MRGVAGTRVVTALVAALLPGALAARAADLEVAVTTTDGARIAGGRVNAWDQSLDLPAGGKVAFRGLPERRIAVTADLLAGKGRTRYLGVAEVTATAGKPVAVRIAAQPVREIEPFCASCHPGRGEPLGEGQIRRDAHVSGRELAPRYLAQVGKFAAYLERKRAEGTERPPEPIVLEERVVKVAGKEVKKYFYTCESCHTLHVSTPWTSYARAAFRDKGTLCSGCHY